MRIVNEVYEPLKVIVTDAVGGDGTAPELDFFTEVSLVNDNEGINLEGNASHILRALEEAASTLRARAAARVAAGELAPDWLAQTATIPAPANDAEDGCECECDRCIEAAATAERNRIN